MSMNLATKYRPQSFEDVTEQGIIVEIVRKMCKSTTLSNRNFLFTGPAGCGKTTIGRLIAKNLNGSSQNVIEIDAASHSGVDDMRELIQEASQYPVGTEYKCIIVDECHVISSAGWQALLKCLEEQVAKTVFIFCTTNPEKIPATILSRVQTFKLSKISSTGIYNRLVHIIECENSEGQSITYTSDALEFLSRYANGGMRDAITSLDKVLAYGSNIDSKLLADALDLPNYDDYFDLLNALVRKDNASIVNILDRVYNSGTNYIKWFESYHSFLCNIVKFIFMQDINKTMIPHSYLDKIKSYNTQHAVLCLKLSNVILNLNKDLKNTNYQLETSISYLCVPTVPKKES